MPLTKRETEVFDLLAKGRTYRQIAEALGMSRANLHMVCYSIRKKTGIQSTRESKQVANHKQMLYFNTEPGCPQPTKKQIEVLRMVAEGKTHKEICSALNMKPSTAFNHASEGYKRFCIPDTGLRRIAQLRVLLGMDEPPNGGRVTMEDPFFN